MNEKQLHALAAEFAKTLKIPEDLNQLSRMLKKWTISIQNWKLAMNRFMIDFGARLDEHC